MDEEIDLDRYDVTEGGGTFKCPGGELVYYSDVEVLLAENTGPGLTPPYTHPADQVAEDVVEPAHSDVSVPRETLAMLLKRMERDWALIDSEWGPSKLGLDGEIEKGNCPEIAELRALLNGGQE